MSDVVLAVCMASNRKLSVCRENILAALDYCRVRGAKLIVSDNSGDEEKRLFMTALEGPLVYIPDAPLDPFENLMTALECVDTPFLLLIGDDDMIRADPTYPFVDLMRLPDDHAGVKLLTEVCQSDWTVAGRWGYRIDAETPGERVHSYMVTIRDGNNSAYYSIFRTHFLRPLIRFVGQDHPLKGGYLDRALAMALLAYGKLEYEPATIFSYNATNWADEEQINAAERRSYLSAGLTEDFEKYRFVMMYMDAFVFATRRDGPLPFQATLTSLEKDFAPIFNYFLQLIVDEASEYPDEVRLAAMNALMEGNLQLKFLKASDILEYYVPGLKARYIGFLQKSMKSRNAA